MLLGIPARRYVLPVIWIAVLTMHAGAVEVPEITRPHPRLLLNAKQVATVRERALSGRAPFTESWRLLRRYADGALNLVPTPYTGTDSVEAYFATVGQAEVTRDLALAWHISGQEPYALKALELLLAWSNAKPPAMSRVDPQDRQPGSGMHIGRATMPFVWAYDLLYEHPSWTREQRETVEAWFRVLEMQVKRGILRWHRNDYFNRQYYQNHLAAHVMALTLIGYVLGDRELVQYAIASPENPRDFVQLLEGMIFMPGDAPHHREPAGLSVQRGELYDRYRHHTARGRGLQYAHLSMTLLTITAEACLQNGLDFYAYTAPTGERLEYVYDFYAPFYAAMKSDLQGGFYAGECHRMGRAGDDPMFFELAHARFPENENIQAVLLNHQRPGRRFWLLGWPTLLYGAEENQCTPGSERRRAPGTPEN